MKYRRAIIVAVLAISWAGELCAQTAPAAPAEPQRRRIVQALMDRSRLLEDVCFTVPRSVWSAYLRDGPLRALPPVGCVSELGAYRLTVSADGTIALTTEVQLNVLDSPTAGQTGVLSGAVAWSDVRLARRAGDKGVQIDMPLRDGFLRYSPTQEGLHTILARAELGKLAGAAGTIELSVPQTVRTLVEFNSPQVFQVAVSGSSAQITGQAG
jgi:hypothetical protein